MTRCLAAFVLLAAMPQLAAAGEARAQFAVTAYVPPRVTLETVSQPAMLAVSEVDVARGYVVVAATYRVQNNDPGGYLIRLAPRVGLASVIEVSGLASGVVMHDDIVEVLQPAALRAKDLALRFHLQLDAAAVPGTYPMPVHVAVTPL